MAVRRGWIAWYWRDSNWAEPTQTTYAVWWGGHLFGTVTKKWRWNDRRVRW